MTGSTVRALIRGDDPVLRPRRRCGTPVVLVCADGRLETGAFELMFTEAAVWDVARIDSRLRLRPDEHPQRDVFAIVRR